MKHYKEKTIPKHAESILYKTTCDLCKERIEGQGLYNVDEVTITHRTGKSYPEGGFGHTLSIDLCSKCFVELVGELKERGCTTTTKEWDF